MTDLTENDICVPGEWKCDRCGFVVVKSVINPASGEVGRSVADAIDLCPNDGHPLRRVRLDEACKEARETACKFAMATVDLEIERDELLAVIRRIGVVVGCNHTEDPEGRHKLVKCVRESIGSGR